MHPILSSSPSSLLSFLDDIEKIKNGTNPIEKNPDFPPSQELDTSHSEFSPPLGSHNPSHEVDSDTDTDVEGEDDHEEQIRDRADTSVDLTQSKLESYKYCLNVLKIDEPTSEAGKRALASEIRKIDAFKLDDAEANALVTLGNLFQHGYYESEKGYEQTNSSMALLCYKKAFDAGHLEIIGEAIDVSKFIQGSSLEITAAKRETQNMLSALKKIRDCESSNKAHQKIDALFKAAEKKFTDIWSVTADASSSTKRRRRI